MKRLLTILFVIFLLPGCANPRAPFKPSTGLLYTDIKAPLTLDFENQKMIKTQGAAMSTYVAYYFLSFSIGDNSLQKAIKDGMLEHAEYADYEWLCVLGMFGRMTVNAYGPERPEED